MEVLRYIRSEWFENISAHSHHFISFHQEGVAPNRDALGAKIEIHTHAGVQYDQVIGNSGWASNNGRWIYFGLANQIALLKVVIRWPSGAIEEIEDLNGDQKYAIPLVL